MSAVLAVGVSLSPTVYLIFINTRCRSVQFETKHLTCGQRPADRKVIVSFCLPHHGGFKGNLTEQRTVSCSEGHEAKTFDFLLLELSLLAAAHRATVTFSALAVAALPDTAPHGFGWYCCVWSAPVS